MIEQVVAFWVIYKSIEKNCSWRIVLLIALLFALIIFSMEIS